MCLNICTSFRFFLPKNKSVREKIIPFEVLADGQQSCGPHPNTIILFHPRRHHPWVLSLPLGPTWGWWWWKVQGLCTQEQNQHRQVWLSSSKELVAKSSGEGAGREVGELRNRSEDPGFNGYPEVTWVTPSYK